MRLMCRYRNAEAHSQILGVIESAFVPRVDDMIIRKGEHWLVEEVRVNIDLEMHNAQYIEIYIRMM